MILLFLFFSLFLLTSSLDPYESLCTTSQNISADDDGTSTILINYFDTSVNKIVIQKFSLSDGTCTDTNKFSLSYLSNSKLYYLNTMGYFILANKQSLLVNLNALSTPPSTLGMSPLLLML